MVKFGKRSLARETIMALPSSRLLLSRATCCYPLSTFRAPPPLQIAPTAAQSFSTGTASGEGPSTEGSAVSPDTRNLLASIFQISQNKVDVSDVNALCLLTKLLRESPAAAAQVWEVGGVVLKLVELQDCGLTDAEEQARVCLSLLGHAPQYSGRGLRILSIDGGGTRSALVIDSLTWKVP